MVAGNQPHHTWNSHLGCTMKTAIRISALTAIVFAACCFGQEPTKPICGLEIMNYSPQVERVQVACVDFEALRKMGVPIPTVAKSQTQVFVWLREGLGVDVQLNGGVWRYDRTQRDAEGKLFVSLIFDGIDYTEIVHIKTTPAN